MPPAEPRDLHVFIVAGEDSGDALGASLMRALRAESGGAVRFSGVGGDAMAAEGLASLFPLTDLALFGVVQVVPALRRVLARIRATADAVVAAEPDVLVIVDSPDFTHRVARRVRARAPHIPIVDYVSPTVWAWRPGRARAMRRYIDHVMALLPFEPEAHRTLGGPPCTYVGHPAAEKLALLRPGAEEAARRAAAPPVLLVLPGSRKGEIARLAPMFGEALTRLVALHGPLDLVLPTLPHRRAQVEAATAAWDVRPRIVDAPEERYAAFRVARVALAASGTVTLELAIAGVPMVAAYRVGAIEAALAHMLIRVPSVVLANLVLGENVVPELLQSACTPGSLAAALAPLLADTPERRRQSEAFARLDSVMEVAGTAPSQRAAEVVLGAVRR
jgi:lipid-A-disaccharide synthase